MSICQDRDFLLYRLRLILFQSGDPVSQRFVSLPLSDDWGYIASSQGYDTTCINNSLKSGSTIIGTRIDSLKDPFHPNGTPSSLSELPLRRAHTLASRQTIRPSAKRFAGTFAFSQESLDSQLFQPSARNASLPNVLSVQEPLVVASPETKFQTPPETAPKESSDMTDTVFGTPQVHNLSSKPPALNTK